MKQLFGLKFLLLFCFVGYGQFATTGFDSVELHSIDGDTLHVQYSKTKRLENLWKSTSEVVKDGGSETFYNYRLRYEQGTLLFSSNKGGWPAMQINKERRETVYTEQFTTGGNIGRSLLVVFLPRFMSVSGEKEVAWRYNALLQGNTDTLHLHCYLKGTTEKETRMMKNSQGMNLPQTETTTYLQYDRGAAGYVLKGTDTLSEWYASITPQKDSGMFTQASSILSERPDKFKHKLGLFVYNQSVYGLKGFWNNEPFSIIFNDLDNKAWIFWNDQLTAVYLYPGWPLRRAVNMIKVPDEQDPYRTYILVNPTINNEAERKTLLQQAGLAAWMVDVMSRPA